MLHKAIGTCPELIVQLGKADVRCLLDTGAQVSTITEACFNPYFGDEERLVDVAPYTDYSGKWFGHTLSRLL